MNTSPDAAVVGGGVIGLSVAWRAARRGVAVTVIDPEPGRGASWAAAGMLAPVTEAEFGEDTLLRLNLASAAIYPTFVDELKVASGRDPGYARCGTLLIARDSDDVAQLERLLGLQRSLGLEAERLPGRACRSLEPSLATTTRAGILVEEDHQIDNRALIVALLAACEEAGITLLRESVERVEFSGGRVTGVRCSGGLVVGAPQVVLAPGCWVTDLLGLPPEAMPPVRPIKGQLLHLRGPARLASRIVRGLDVYIVPRPDGRVVVGATVEERGFDATVTAGAVHELLRRAYELVPGITELELTETTVGLRPGSPDNAPMIGRSSLDGLLIATGHHRNGILLAPVTADAIAELLVTGSTPEEIAPFSPQRFAPQAVR